MVAGLCRLVGRVSSPTSFPTYTVLAGLPPQRFRSPHLRVNRLAAVFRRSGRATCGVAHVPTACCGGQPPSRPVLRIRCERAHRGVHHLATDRGREWTSGV